MIKGRMTRKYTFSPGAPAHHAVIQAIFKHIARGLTEAVQQI